MNFRNLLITILVTLNFAIAQEVGEIFDNKVLDKLFGKVVTDVKLEVNKLEELIPQAGEFIMFRIIDNELVILDQYRNQLLPIDHRANFNYETVFKFFSVNVLYKLLETSDEKYLTIEEREKTLVVKYKTKSMERGGDCPPHCPTIIYANSFN